MEGQLDNIQYECQINSMSENGIQIHDLPDLKNPLLIAAFEGWGNALQISSTMAAYLIRQFKAQKFAEINSDAFYRYDEMRPRVRIEDGIFKSLELPGGAFYAAKAGSDGRDLVILKADEPSLRWVGFVEELFDIASRLNIETIITLGSMYDHVLHTDRFISAVASDTALISMLNQKGVNSISYQGPTAIHSTIHAEGIKKGWPCMSLWCHCPFYLQGTIHYGLLAHLGTLLASVGGFELNIEDLEKEWEQLNEQIENLIEKNAKLKAVIDDILKAKKQGLTTLLKSTIKSDEKIINIQDFLKPK
jgi:proteasome assembly chaperone (PAC2) family protein